MNNLVYRNNLLLSQNNLLIDCCCDNSPTSLYYEAVPCDAVLGVAPAECCSGTACAMQSSKYIDYLSYCDGDIRYICECQLLKMENHDRISWDHVNNLVALSINDANYPTGEVVLTENDLSLTLYPTGGGSPNSLVINFTGYYRSLASTFADFLSNGDLWSGVMAVGYPDSCSVYGLKPTGFSINYGQTKYFNGRTRYKISLDDEISEWLYLSSGNIDPVISGVQSFSTVGLGNATGYLLDDGFFTTATPRWHIDFDGSGVCGQEFSPLQEYKNGTVYTVGGIPNSELHELNLIDGNRQSEVDPNDDFLDHRILGSGTYTTAGTCPFNQDKTDVLLRDYGFRCCPQKGCIVGPDQFIGPTGGTIHDLPDLSILEPTFYYNSRCYQVSPYFYVYGLLGRFIPSMIEPNVDITGSTLPTNAAVRLFINSFNQSLPWGGFGGYCADLEDRLGPCSDPASLYRPIGYSKLEGEWLESKFLWLKFKFYEALPFTEECDSGDYATYLSSVYSAATALRHDPGFPAIQRVAGLIDNSTLAGAFTTVNSGAGNNWYYTLKYNLSGKTITNLVTDLNSIKTLITHTGGTQTQGCSVFAACYGLPEIQFTPAHLLNNASSDLFELGLKCNYTDAAYMPFEDGDLKITADILLPKPYINSFPTIEVEGTSSNLPDVTPPNLYDSIPANIPPKNRILSSLPNRGCNEIGFTNGPSQWYNNLQLYPDITAVIRKNSLPSYYNSLTATMISGLLTITATSGVNTFTGTINTNKDGSGYRVIDFINACTGLSITDSGNTFYPITATSGTQPFDIWLDDHTWASGTALSYPMNPYASGAFKTTINYAYKEPFINITGAIELFNGQRMDLSCVLRNRSWSLVPINSGSVTGYFITDWFDSISPANKIGKVVNLDCTRDVVEDRSWITYYGCLSPVCKTRYYYEAEHCGCSQIWGHGGDDGGGDDGGGDGGINALFASTECGPTTNPYLLPESYPTVYICEDNIHPLYNKPILLKVPAQSFSNTPDVFCPSDYWQKYNNVLESDISVVYDDTDGASENGWCQYIRPGITPKVKHEDIPRTYPASAYINDRVCVPFYPTKPYTVTAFDSYESFEVFPHYPPEYIDPITGIPCNLSEALNVYMRAAVSPFMGSEWEYNWQGFAACQRIDVDCTTKCCGCFFLPEVSGGSCCLIDGPYSCNCSQNINYTSIEVRQEAATCCIITPIVNRCPGAGCQYISSYSETKWVADGKIIITTTSEGELLFHYGCCDCEGTVNTSQTVVNNTVCDGFYGGDTNRPVFNCCVEGPPPGSGYYLCPGFTTCIPNEPSIQDCVDPSNLDPISSTTSFSSHSCYTNEGTCDNNLDGIVDDNPADIDNHFIDIEQEDVYGVDICGFGLNTRSREVIVTYAGTAGPSDSPCFNGRVLGWHSANPTVYEDTLTSTLDLSIQYGPITCADCSYSVGGVPTYTQFKILRANIQLELICGTTAY